MRYTFLVGLLLFFVLLILAVYNLSNENKEKISEIFFLYKNYEDLKAKSEEQTALVNRRNKIIIDLLDNNNTFHFEQRSEIKPEVNYTYGKDFIRKKENISFNNILGQDLILKKFAAPVLNSTGPRAYFEYYEEKLFISTGTGTIIYSELKDLSKDNLKFKKISSNFMNKLGSEYVRDRKSIVKDIFIKNDKVYLSVEKKLKEDCFISSIIQADFDLEYLDFYNFFDMKECQPEFSNNVGGMISDFKDNKILFAIGDYDSSTRLTKKYTASQDKQSLLGKIVSVNLSNADFEILSMGHRSQSGLFYFADQNIIINSEHGPQGGDEININTNPFNNTKNFGWPIASYGEHYGFPERDNTQKYIDAPLKKSHKEFGFEEPLKEFTPSIGISDFIVNEDFFGIKDKTIFIVGALGYDVSEGDQSLHILVYDQNYILENHEILVINDRIRDIIYIKDLKKIYLFLETFYDYSHDGSWVNSIASIEISN